MSEITIDLFNPNVKAQLAMLPKQMGDYAEEVLLKQAYVAKGYAQVYAPVDTGSLRDSIRVERGGIGLNRRVIRVRAGGYVTNPRTGKRVDYAMYQEAKTQFLRRAINEVTPQIATMIKANVVSKVMKT